MTQTYNIALSNGAAHRVVARSHQEVVDELHSPEYAVPATCVAGVQPQRGAPKFYKVCNGVWYPISAAAAAVEQHMLAGSGA